MTEVPAGPKVAAIRWRSASNRGERVRIGVSLRSISRAKVASPAAWACRLGAAASVLENQISWGAGRSIDPGAARPVKPLGHIA